MVDALAVTVTSSVVVVVAVVCQSRISVFNRRLEETHSQNKVVSAKKIEDRSCDTQNFFW